jgi:hypothetical protein
MDFGLANQAEHQQANKKLSLAILWSVAQAAL